jgi:hypothetical protein
VHLTIRHMHESLSFLASRLPRLEALFVCLQKVFTNI